MTSAVGTRRSLLHDVLSELEVEELGLDGSIEDLPSLTTRLTPSCARVVNAFCWCYFICFWTSAAVLARHVAVSDPGGLLPGAYDFLFVYVCTTLLVALEFMLYRYVKAANDALPDSGGPMGVTFPPTTSCIYAHFALSATSRMCAFLELLFFFHTLVLPMPMLVCTACTCSLTSGAASFLLQLRSLVSYLCCEAFDPLQCSACLPLSSVAACISRVGRGLAALVVKGTYFVLGMATAAKGGIIRLAGRCVRFVRRTASTSPGRRVDISRCLADSGARLIERSDNDETWTAPRPENGRGRTAGRDRAVCTAQKEPSAGLDVCHFGPVESAHDGSEADAARAAVAAHGLCSSEASARMQRTDRLPLEGVTQTPVDVVVAHNEQSRPGRVAVSPARVAPLRFVGPRASSVSTDRDGRMLVSPRQALNLANCLLFLDVPGINLYFKANFLPLEQLEAHEFLTSVVSLVRLYSGDFCLLLYLVFGLYTFGVNELYVILLIFLLLKLKFSCFATILVHIASVFALWDVP